jgi:IclR family acetate operon transcriptional repressor
MTNEQADGSDASENDVTADRPGAAAASEAGPAASGAGAQSGAGAPSGAGVQSVQRALDLLEAIHQRGGELGISDLAAAVALPLPTIHRLLRTLANRGYIRQLPNRRYALGFRLVPLAGLARTTVGGNAGAVLGRLVDALGETANLAVLSGDRAQYVAQVPSPHEMRTFTETGRLVDLHATGVGKALLAASDPARIKRVASGDLAGHTRRTITDGPALSAALAEIRDRGYSLDDEEQAIGVRCVAVTLTGELSWIAVSVSGPTSRMTDGLIERAVPLLQEAARDLSADIGGSATAEKSAR